MNESVVYFRQNKRVSVTFSCLGPKLRSIQSHTLPTPTLRTFSCTQVLWCLARLARPRSFGVTMRPDTRLTIISTRVTQCM